MQHHDWVKAAANCNAKHVFEALREIMEADVESARDHVQGQITSEFQDQQYIVERVAFGVRASRCVFVVGRTIHARDQTRGTLVTAEPVLAGDRLGEPEVKVTGDQLTPSPQTMALWEFSRLILKDVFFPENAAFPS